MSIADQLNVTPWAALLEEVRLSSGRIAWIDQQLVEAVRADEEYQLSAQTDGMLAGIPSGAVPRSEAVRDFMAESRAERKHRATVAKDAINCGVAERVVHQLEIEGQVVADAVLAALDTLALSVDDRTAAMAAAHTKLLALGASASDGGTVIEGEVAP